MKVRRDSFLTVNFYCPPHPEESEVKEFEKLYKKLHNDTVFVARSFGELRIKSESDMLNLFHPDLMSYELGAEVKVVIENVPLKAEYCRHDFLKAVMRVVKDVFPQAQKVIGEVYLEKDNKETYFIMEDH